MDGKTFDFCYSADDDWSLPEDWRFQQNYLLDESFLLPSPVSWVGEGENLHYEYNEAGTAAIKKQLMNLRGVEVAFCADVSRPDQANVETKYISENWAHYTWFGETANHGVCVVGWDDNYPKENFAHKVKDKTDAESAALTTPPENGAWLVKNSWGSGERDFPHRGYGTWGLKQGQDGVLNEATGKYEYKPICDDAPHTGYFWLSYYDKSITMVEALSFDMVDDHINYYKSQHDYLPANTVMSMDLDKETRMANVFKCDQAQTLKEISFQTAAPGTTMDYEIYLLKPGFKDPQDGTLMTYGTVANIEYGGYHKVEIEPVKVKNGRYFSIVVTQRTPTGKYNVNTPSGFSKDMAKIMNMPSYQETVIHPGESYLKTKGKWYDFSDANLRADTFGGFFIAMNADNFPLRAFGEMEDNEYTITYDLNGGTLDGQTGPIQETYVEGTEITLPEPTKDGATFLYWKGSRYDAGDTYPVTEDHTFTAQWEEDAAPADTTGNSHNAKTGDSSHLSLWVALMVMSLMGMVVVIGVRRRQS